MVLKFKQTLSVCPTYCRCQLFLHDFLFLQDGLEVTGACELVPVWPNVRDVAYQLFLHDFLFLQDGLEVTEACELVPVRPNVPIQIHLKPRPANPEPEPEDDIPEPEQDTPPAKKKKKKSVATTK